jgi:mRNA interferase RelE/StbE
MSEPDLSRVVAGIAGLLQEPPRGDIEKMGGGRSDYRLCVGNYRVLFRIERDIIQVDAIATRGQAYKKKR